MSHQKSHRTHPNSKSIHSTQTINKFNTNNLNQPTMKKQSMYQKGVNYLTGKLGFIPYWNKDKITHPLEQKTIEKPIKGILVITWGGGQCEKFKTTDVGAEHIIGRRQSDNIESAIFTPRQPANYSSFHVPFRMDTHFNIGKV